MDRTSTSSSTKPWSRRACHFLAAQLVLGFFVWRFGGRKNGPLKNFPGGAKYLVHRGRSLVGAEAIALGAMGTKAWGRVYFQPASADALPIQVQAGQFAFYFRYAGPDGKFGVIHPEKIDEGNSNFFGLDPENDVAARDDIQSGEFVIPVNKEIHLMMHAKDVGHSFYVANCEFSRILCLDSIFPFTSPRPRSGSTRSSARSCAGSGTTT